MSINPSDLTPLEKVAEELTASTTELKDSIVESFTADNTRLRRIIKLLVGAMGVVLLVLGFQLYRNLAVTQPVLDRLDKQQADLTILVDFVKDVQNASNEEQQDLQVFVDLLCASSDPIRIQHCVAIGALPAE